MRAVIGISLSVILAGAACGADHAGTAGGGAANGSAGKGGGSGSGKGGGSGSGKGGGFAFDPGPVAGNTGTGGNSEMNCEPNLTAVIRDFPPTHPDFETYSGTSASLGIVMDMLGADRKPVYSKEGAFIDPRNRQQVTSRATFDEWYRTIKDVNQAFEFRIMMTPLPGGVFSFDSDAFFPIDGRGFGNGSNPHNYHFTTELHTEFTYNGGETFAFKGDDDLWVFINNKLAIDLGGLHPRLDDDVMLDTIATAFGLVKGKSYPLDLFHAERHTDKSNFRVDTTIKFTNCNAIIIE